MEPWDEENPSESAGTPCGFDDGACACDRGSKKTAPITKIHAATIDENSAVALHVTAGKAHDGRRFERLYENLEAGKVLPAAVLDKGTVPTASGSN